MPNETPKSKCCNASPVFVGLTHVCSACGQMFVYREPENLQMNSSSIDKTDKTIYPPSKEQIAKQCTCGLQAHPQPNCPAKQPDEMPDVIYASSDIFDATSGVLLVDTKIHGSYAIPYIRKSIHDEKIESLNKSDWTASMLDRLNELLREHPVVQQVNNGAEGASAITVIHGYCGSQDSKITKLKSKLKECVELLEWVGTTGCGCESSKGFLDTQKVITSAKGLYE